MKHKSIEEITSLVMECRSSGLTDHQWCLANSINPSTFYRWVHRLRKSNCAVPKDTNANFLITEKQEVVKLEVVDSLSEKVEYNTPISQSENLSSVIEIAAQNITIRFSNGVNPELFKTALMYLGGSGIC